MIRSRLDFVLDHDPERLQAWLAERPGDAPPWRLFRLDGADRPDDLFRQVRACLRQDPDGFLLVGFPALDPELAALLGQAVENGHAVLATGCAPDVAGAVRGLAMGGATFLAGRELTVEPVWPDLDRAPLPPDLAEDRERYVAWTPDQRLDDPPPVAPGDPLPLRPVACEPHDHDPPGMVEVVPVFPDGRMGRMLVRAALTDAAVMRLQQADALVYRAERHVLDEELPTVTAYRLLLDLPAWLGASARAAEGVRTLARDGRSPPHVLHG